VVLPNASIKRQADITGVWVSRNGELRFVPVRLGDASLAGMVQVLDGLQAGDQVIVHSEREIVSGSHLKIVESLAGSAT